MNDVMIRVKKETKKSLELCGHAGQSMNDVIVMLIDNFKNKS